MDIKVIFKGDCSPEALFVKVMGDHPSCLESSYVRVLGAIVHGQWGLKKFERKNAFRLFEDPDHKGKKWYPISKVKNKYWPLKWQPTFILFNFLVLINLPKNQ